MRAFSPARLLVAIVLLAVIGCSTPIEKWPARFAHELSPRRLNRFNYHADTRRREIGD